MARETYVLRDGKLVPKHIATPLSSGPRIHVISDTMDALRHPITGKPMDSKSEFRKVTRAHNCTEVGNDKWPERKPVESPSARNDIMRAFEQLKNR